MNAIPHVSTVFAVEFQKSLQRPEIRSLMENGRLSATDRIEAIQRRVYGAAAGF